MSYFRLNISPVQFDSFFIFICCSIPLLLLPLFIIIFCVYFSLTVIQSIQSLRVYIYLSIYLYACVYVCVCWQKLVDVRNAMQWMHWNLISSCFIGKSTFFYSFFFFLFSYLLQLQLQLNCIALCFVQWAVTLKIAFRFAYIILYCLWVIRI